MHTELELLHTLRELKTLYKMGELCEYDFDVKISAVEQEIRAFETHMEQELGYDPQREV